MQLHQYAKVLIGPLTPDIIAEFKISITQMEAVNTGGLILFQYYPHPYSWFDVYAFLPVHGVSAFLPI